MRYEIDAEREIVDFYIEDDHGCEYHSGMSFEDAKELLTQILREMRNRR